MKTILHAKCTTLKAWTPVYISILIWFSEIPSIQSVWIIEIKLIVSHSVVKPFYLTYNQAMFQCPSVKDAIRARREPQPQGTRHLITLQRECFNIHMHAGNVYIYIGSEIHTIALSDKQGASLVGPRTIGPYWGNSLIHNCNHVTNSSVRHTNVGSVFQGEPIYLRILLGQVLHALHRMAPLTCTYR